MGMKIRKGDVVQVISGDDKGKTGKVLSIDDLSTLGEIAQERAGAESPVAKGARS